MKINAIENSAEHLSLDSQPIGKIVDLLGKLHLTPNGTLIGLGIITLGGVIIYSIQSDCSINGDLSYKDASIKFEIKKDQTLSEVQA